MSALTVGTRRSQLALWQTNHVCHLLQLAHADLQCELVHFTTKGDKTLDQPLKAIGGKGLFTLELERALHSAEIDLAVHSLKDLPVTDPIGLTTAAIIQRADPRDVLICPAGLTLDQLPSGAVIGTSSVRRGAMLTKARPDLVIRSVRGNVDTRIRKVQTDAYDAIVLAAAGVQRLELDAHITQFLPFATMVPAPGQGAIAVQCRTDDTKSMTLLQAIDDAPTRHCVSAERTFLSLLDGGCSTPLGAYASIQNGQIAMRVMVFSVDSSQSVAFTITGHDPIELANAAATRVLAAGIEVYRAST